MDAPKPLFVSHKRLFALPFSLDAPHQRLDALPSSLLAPHKRLLALPFSLDALPSSLPAPHKRLATSPNDWMRRINLFGSAKSVLSGAVSDLRAELPSARRTASRFELQPSPSSSPSSIFGISSQPFHSILGFRESVDDRVCNACGVKGSGPMPPAFPLQGAN